MSLNLSYEEMKKEGILSTYLTKYGVKYVLDCFFSKVSKHQTWTPLINPSSYGKALTEFVENGTFLHFPKEEVFKWIGIIFRNTTILLSNTALVGRTKDFPMDEIRETFETYGIDSNFNSKDECLARLKVLGFYDWLRPCDGTDGASDFGIIPLLSILVEYNEYTSAEDAFVIVNRCLDVTHKRGDLSTVFIEGGRKTLDKWK